MYFLILKAVANNSVQDCISVIQSHNDDILILRRQILSLGIAIEYAVQKGYYEEILQLLLNQGVPVNYYAVMKAIAGDDKNCLKLLLRYADEIIKQDSAFLIRAMMKPDSRDICKILVKHGAKLNRTKDEVLLTALQARNMDVIDILLFYGCNPLPLLKCTVLSPLKFVFTLPSNIVFNVVKYAALYVQYEDDVELYEDVEQYEYDTIQYSMKTTFSEILL